MSAMPVMIVVLCVMAIAYRYYSAFLAARVATLNDLKATPAVQRDDGQNYHPTNKWVLFGHHFAAISGAGPLIGPVLAAQFGYLPGLIWIVVGVCLGGAVQDFLVLAASIRRGGKSLAQIAFSDVGKVAGIAATVSILFIIVIAIAGLGKVVVGALGGEAVKYPSGSVLILPPGAELKPSELADEYIIPPGATLKWPTGEMTIAESFVMHSSSDFLSQKEAGVHALNAKSYRRVPGSSWGTFTIACTVPIALLVGLWMYKIRPGRVVEASLIGAVLTLGATFLGGVIYETPFGQLFNMSESGIVWSMAIYGFVASVLPVWVLLCPRDYLSSFLKIGTIALLVIGVLIANPKFQAPAFNHVFATGGPVVTGKIFPFLFIVVMCGAISGFHALVSSGTTPKMIKKESDARTIGYGAMLIEGMVGVVALIAAVSLPTMDYYAMNTKLGDMPAYQKRIIQVAEMGGIEHVGDQLAGADNVGHYESLTKESLRGRASGAVTLAVGMAHIFDAAAQRLGARTQDTLHAMWKYWYHFAIMFEALFILTTIDTGTRIGRFLLQEVFGKVSPKWGNTSYWPGAVLSTAMVVGAWTYFIEFNSMAAIWPMFGVANQMLAVIALAIVSAYLANEGKARYLWVTGLPLTIVMITTSTAGVQMLLKQITTVRTQWGVEKTDWTVLTNATIQGLLIALILACGVIVIAAAMNRIWPRTPRAEVRRGFEPVNAAS